jgi:HK97 family phage major capsid protein
MLVELRERMAVALKELGELQNKETRTADDESRIDTLLAEVNDLGPKILREQKIADATGQRSQYEQPSGRQVPGGGHAKEGSRASEEERDTRSWGQRFVESDQVKNYSGRGKGQPFEVGSFYPKHQPTQYRGGMGPQETRALVNTALMPADYISPQRVPGFFRGDDLQGTLRDVLINGQTNSNAILYFRELAFTNNAAGVPEATHTSASSETPVNASVKPESGFTFEQATAPVVTIAHWTPITRQTLEDASEMQTYIEQRLLDGLRLEESNQLLNGNGTNDLTGLLNTNGIQDLDQTYFTGAAVNDAGIDNENYNRILRARTLIRTVGRARANFVVINPADHEDLLTASTASDHQYYGAGPFSGSGITTLWGLRVVEDENLTEGSVLVGDGRMAAVWDRMQAQILIDTIDDQFIRNAFTILAEERLALTVFRPAAFALVDLA